MSQLILSWLTISFLMNLVELKKGEGMYVGADAPHAWLSGGQSHRSGVDFR